MILSVPGVFSRACFAEGNAVAKPIEIGDLVSTRVGGDCDMSKMEVGDEAE